MIKEKILISEKNRHLLTRTYFETSVCECVLKAAIIIFLCYRYCPAHMHFIQFYIFGDFMLTLVILILKYAP
jgi:hypothetical protein